MVNGKKVLLTKKEIDEINAGQEAWRKEHEAKKAKRLREENEISPKQQLELIWKCLDQGLPLDKESDFYKINKLIKDQFPDPNESK